MRHYISLLLFAVVGVLHSQTIDTIDWEPNSSIHLSNDIKQEVLVFHDAEYLSEDNFLPRYNKKVPLANNTSSFSTTIANPKFTVLKPEEIALVKNKTNILNRIKVSNQIVRIQKQAHGIVSFIPIRRNSGTGNYEKLISFELVTSPTLSNNRYNRTANTYASSSILKSGTWHKLAIKKSGVYKISYNWLRRAGINMTNVDPRNIRIYGNGGGMLDELTSTPRPDDLAENAIYISGESDGSFDESDFILFYGKGHNTWDFEPNSCPKFQHNIHLHSDYAYYFISTDIGTGKRIGTQNTSTTPTHYSNTFDDYSFHESETTNFLKSGKLWFGEYFENNSTVTIPFSFPNVVTTEDITVKVAMASRSIGNDASYSVNCQSTSSNMIIAATSEDSYTSHHAKFDSTCFSFNANSDNASVVITKQTADAIAWLDFIEINARRHLIMSGEQMLFRDLQSVGTGNVTQFSLTIRKPTLVWDITDIHNIKSQILTSNGTSSNFNVPTDNLKEFIAFTGMQYLTPRPSGKVENQNLHALSNKDYIIVTHPNFINAAQQLANHHQSKDDLSSVVVTTQQIYNEFSSGSQDVSAIRDFVKMFYDKASSPNELPQYLLLFGDGSYDNKNRNEEGKSFIPTYESENSVVEVSSYVSDDFYGLLDDGEGVWNSDMVDIGVGRIPAKTQAEAQAVVNKIMNYTNSGSNSSDSPFGNWRNTICFIADDGDASTHASQANQQATLIDTTYKNYNIDKIYLDAYPQTTIPGGNRYPKANQALIDRIDQGALILNYTGHGSATNLAHEAVLTIPMIKELENSTKLFLFVTASCQVSQYDDPARVSGGERILLNPDGGAIALLSTVRAVYASPNFKLNKDLYTAAFEPINGKMPTLGDLYKFIKTQSGGNSINSRSFTLLGDPALTLAYPIHQVVTDSINHKTVLPSSSDTLKALSRVTISGHIASKGGTILSNYNGSLYPTVYDKPKINTTLSNKGSSESPAFSFSLQKNRLFNGEVSVKNGFFSFSFIVPKDIAYQYGIGKVSYYADNGNEDANGYYEKVVVGGYNSDAPEDNNPPEVNLFLNDDNFVFGGLTNENPYLYSEVYDENGINSVGNSFGHDITAVLDAETKDPIILNDYYKANKDSYQEGTIHYPFRSLKEGNHTLNLKVWDVYNNSSESYTEFVVASSAQVALSHVLNYPNPFTTNTQFFFEHNQANSTFEVQLQIFTITGKLVKHISQYVRTTGYRSDPISWDGRDDYGDKIGRGVYVYRIKVISSDNGVAEKYEKLVILN